MTALLNKPRKLNK